MSCPRFRVRGDISISLLDIANVRELYDEPEKGDIAWYKKVETPQFSVFVDHGYLQHARCGWHGHYGLHYHIYFMIPSSDLKDAIAFSYGASFSVKK